MNPTKKIIISFVLIILGSVIATIGFCGILGVCMDAEHRAKDGLLSSQAEIQQKLVDLGYDIGGKGIDGVVGEDTRHAWDKAICDRFTEKIFEDAGYDNE